jgi:hypothetical protein
MSGTRVVATSTLPAVPSNPAWNIAGILDGPQPGSWLVVGHNRVNRRVIVWTIEGASLASAVTITGASGLPVQTPVGSTVPAVRRFADDESFSLLVRSSAGRVDRWRIDPAGRYLRGSAVTATNQPSMMLRPD